MGDAHAALGIYEHRRMAFVASLSPKLYVDMGIECDWQPIEAISAEDAGVAESDYYCEYVWALQVAIVKYRFARCLLMTDGYPRIFKLCLDDEHRPEVIANFRLDIEVYEALKAIDREWVGQFTKRSLFNRPRVAQYRLCFEAEGFEWTPRRIL